MADNSKGNRLPALIAVALTLLLVVAAIGAFFTGGDQPAPDRAAPVAQLAAEAQKLGPASEAALAGDPAAFDALDQARSRLGAATPLGRAAGTLGAARETLTGAAATSQELAATASGLARRLEGLGGALTPEQGRAATAAAVAARTMGVLGTGLINGAPVEPTLRQLADQEMLLGQVVLGFAGKDTTSGVAPLIGGTADLAALERDYRALSAQTLALVNAGEGINAAREAQAAVVEALPGYTRGLAATSAPVASDSGGPGWLPWLLLAGAALAGLLAYGLFRSRPGGLEGDRQNLQNDRNQDAILRLLDELGSLADGDLTVQATVTEDITGAIADSINYAIEALRDLVATIDATATKVDAAARQTQATAGHLASASDTQSKQVADATESIARMAASVEAVSGDAERSADVARHSVDVAHKGGEAVRRTIEGMNTIRETIQDTSKRIKRLGESSQEIGNIVELINDIAEQTNILALNASIQASMAGEAGRGFAVVADEVQRLAERATNATRQIEVLVKTIQSDTNEAVVSMERSTTDVVGGALLAENAGAALDEIESVSGQIASLVQNISRTAREQATASGDITRNMNILQEVSAQTADATNATSASIGKLAELAKELRASVSGFRLPEDPGRTRTSAFPQRIAKSG